MIRLGMREWLAAGRAIAGGDLSRYGGPHRYCLRFEEELAARMGASHALTVSSGTSALVCALAAAGVGPGDEVIVPAYTWMATAAAVAHVGAAPVLAEVDETLTLDPAEIERLAGPATRAVIPVHMANVPCDMDRILPICARLGLTVIEDAAQAIGVRYRGRMCGAMGALGCYSFNQYKNMSIGEGGAVVTSDPALMARAWNFHDLGAEHRQGGAMLPEAPLVGGNMRATEIEGAMLRVQLRRLRSRISRMRSRHEVMRARLEAMGLPVAPHNDRETAIGLFVTFQTPAEAEAFAQNRGVDRLMDNSKHVYTQWRAVLERRMHSPRFDPWGWSGSNAAAARRLPDAGACPRTLDLMSRTCKIALGERYPMPAVHLLAKSLRYETPPHARLAA